jgi:hypothetical protein
VEAYPTKRWGAYQEWRGTVSMFEKEGFRDRRSSQQKQCVDAKNHFELPSNVKTCVIQIRRRVP